MNHNITADVERIRKRHLARKAVREFGVEVLFNRDGASHIVSFKNEYDGGEGSGNWGHEGRKGKIGGSAPGGGVHNRQEASNGKYTSFAKKRKQLATPHKASANEFRGLKNKTKVIFSKKGGGNKCFTYNIIPGEFVDECGTSLSPAQVASYYGDNMLTSILIPNSANSNFTQIKDTSNITPARMNNAKRYTAAEDADKALRPESRKVWKTLSDDEKSALVSYTGIGFANYNPELRDPNGGLLRSKSLQKEVDNITAAISTSHLQEDTWLYRGISPTALPDLFGLNTYSVKGEDIVGKFATDKGFVSCASIPTTTIKRGVNLKIFCPKGTQALYVEPFSEHGGGGPKEGWDGESTQTKFGESETILQRGTSFVCTGFKTDEDGTLEVELAVTGQYARKLDW